MKKEFSTEEREELLSTLKIRFEKNTSRHKGLEWAKVQAKLEGKTEKLWSLNEMERTGGEPDVVGHDKKTGQKDKSPGATRALKSRVALPGPSTGLKSRPATSWVQSCPR